MTATSALRVIGVSSPGSRWAELNAIVRALGSSEPILVQASSRFDAQTTQIARVSDFSIFSIWKLPVCAWQLFWLMARHRPQMVISTGAAPGVLALAIGRLWGARCVWVESLTSTENMSLSGSMAGWFAHLWLTQWPEIARPRGPHFKGSLL